MDTDFPSGWLLEAFKSEAARKAFFARVRNKVRSTNALIPSKYKDNGYVTSGGMRFDSFESKKKTMGALGVRGSKERKELAKYIRQARNKHGGSLGKAEGEGRGPLKGIRKIVYNLVRDTRRTNLKKKFKSEDFDSVSPSKVKGIIKKGKEKLAKDKIAIASILSLTKKKEKVPSTKYSAEELTNIARISGNKLFPRGNYGEMQSTKPYRVVKQTLHQALKQSVVGTPKEDNTLEKFGQTDEWVFSIKPSQKKGFDSNSASPTGYTRLWHDRAKLRDKDGNIYLVRAWENKIVVIQGNV